MADEVLVAWVKEQQKAGYKPKQLKDFLLNEGYDPSKVEASIRAARTLTKRDILDWSIGAAGIVSIVFGIILL
jgi:hypothetical protein